MPVTKVVALGALIVSLSALQARGDAMLSLATTSGDWSGTTSQAWAPTPWGGNGNGNGSAPLALGTWSANTQYAPAPGPMPAPSPAPAPAPAASNSGLSLSSFGSTPAPQPSNPGQPTYDAFLNVGAGPFPNSGSLTTGNPLPWYQSRAITGLFGGTPTAQQQSDFDATVLKRVEQTFALSGVPIKLTEDPNAAAAHTLSVVSNTVNPTMGSVIGMTYLGGNGFHYIDNSAGWAKSVDQLEWIVAHNVSHELMLAFGVGEVHDQSGNFIDARTGNLSSFLNQFTTFSPGAVQDLLSKNFQAGNTSNGALGAQLVGADAVPEPASIALWGLVAIGLVGYRVRSNRRSA